MIGYAMSQNLLSVIFCALAACGYQLTSPDTIDYNCVAWAAEDRQN
ncbi:hypothetical protein NIES4071_52140 [Calothrix sp. NIES-4071]|nr:hypothetical protein NIES4071_52140 [Calothrix sp. NIES-4071]BAZ59522.1 hypothetical protein NIES4105_52090 [Calothrix sp. NIES-4105]